MTTMAIKILFVIIVLVLVTGFVFYRIGYENGYFNGTRDVLEVLTKKGERK
jgi:Ni,Fe-hydrogenase I cytochrome b subunit